jgi:hypothetical protein
VQVAMHRALKSRGAAWQSSFVKTSQLIAALSADPVPAPVHIGRRVWAALTVGLIMSLIFLPFSSA